MIKKIIKMIEENKNAILFRENLLLNKTLTKAERAIIKVKIKSLLKVKKQLLKTFEEIQKQ